MCYGRKLCTNTFDGNLANNGAAMNLIRYGAELHKVTFKNNRQSAVRVSL